MSNHFRNLLIQLSVLILDPNIVDHRRQRKNSHRKSPRHIKQQVVQYNQILRHRIARILLIPTLLPRQNLTFQYRNRVILSNSFSLTL